LTPERSPDAPLAADGLAMARNPCFAHACHTCCRDTEMPLRDADIARLEALGHVAKDFAAEDDGWVVLQNRDGACVFLDTRGQCSVYEDRPEGCRIYPLVFEEQVGPALDELCPWRSEFSPGVQEHRRLQALVRVLVNEREARRAD
jgi:uncharacterized protein